MNQKVQYSTINFSEISLSSKIDVTTLKLAVSRLAKEISIQAKFNKPVMFEIPALGVFHLRNKVAAVDFDIFFKGEVKVTLKFIQNVMSKSLVERYNEKNSLLTEANLKSIEYSKKRNLTEDKPLEIDENTLSYLKKSLNIEMPEIIHSKKPYLEYRNKSLDRLPRQDEDIRRSLLLSKPTGFLTKTTNKDYK